MKLLGKRILIKKPERKESSIIELSEEQKEAMDREMMMKYSKLEVAEVGDECTSVKKGDTVYVGRSLEHAEIIDVEGSLFFMLNEAQVSIIW